MLRNWSLKGAVMLPKCSKKSIVSSVAMYETQLPLLNQAAFCYSVLTNRKCEHTLKSTCTWRPSAHCFILYQTHLFLLTLFSIYGWSCGPHPSLNLNKDEEVKLQWFLVTQTMHFFSFSNDHDDNRNVRQPAKNTRPHWCTLVCLLPRLPHPLVPESSSTRQAQRERWSSGRQVSEDQLAIVPVWLDFRLDVTHRSVWLLDSRL